MRIIHYCFHKYLYSKLWGWKDLTSIKHLGQRNSVTSSLLTTIMITITKCQICYSTSELVLHHYPSLEKYVPDTLFYIWNSSVSLSIPGDMCAKYVILHYNRFWVAIHLWRQRYKGKESVNNSLKIAELESGKVRIQTQDSPTWKISVK